MCKLIILKCKHKDKGDSKVKLKANNEVLSNEMIVKKLKELVEANKLIF
jgi:hypothetical protein